MDVSVFTRVGVERIARYACELALSRPRQKLTIVTKSNAQRHGMVFWDEVCQEIVADYPGLDVDFMLVDAMTQRMVLKPWSLDTILATNLHADILSDLAASLTGGLGIGATANLDPTRRLPSMFEPIHGSAFDIREGRRQPYRRALDGLPHARPFGRVRSLEAADAGDRNGHRKKGRSCPTISAAAPRPTRSRRPLSPRSAARAPKQPFPASPSNSRSFCGRHRGRQRGF